MQINPTKKKKTKIFKQINKIIKLKSSDFQAACLCIKLETLLRSYIVSLLFHTLSDLMKTTNLYLNHLIFGSQMFILILDDREASEALFIN